MNKGNVSENRICWTIESLNHTMDLHRDIDNLRIQRKDNYNSHSGGTISNARLIEAHIGEKYVDWVAKKRKIVKWDPKFWFTGPCDQVQSEKPSDRVELAFNNVGDFFLAHQDAWDNAEHAIDENDAESSDSEDGEENIPYGYED